MKFFFWQLDNKEKFTRALWTGFLGLIFLYVVVWYYAVDVIFPIVLTALYMAYLVIRYKKIKR